LAGGGVLPSPDAYLDRWADLHGGYDPRGNGLVRRWLLLTYAVARPLAVARVPPDVVTGLAVVVSALAVWAAAGTGWWLALAAVVAVVAGLLDNVDGAVAVLRGRVTRWGAVLDAVGDRLSDLLLVAALAVAGAPWQVAVAGAALMFLQEYARARATGVGLAEVGVVTVWERPTRVIVTAAFLAAAAPLGSPWPALGAWAWVGLGVVGLTQLLVVVRRRLM
jgi:phosphatidylglycerophosphate synthase